VTFWDHLYGTLTLLMTGGSCFVFGAVVMMMQAEKDMEKAGEAYQRSTKKLVGHARQKAIAEMAEKVKQFLDDQAQRQH
jgi:hypothetical protein